MKIKYITVVIVAVLIIAFIASLIFVVTHPKQSEAIAPENLATSNHKKYCNGSDTDKLFFYNEYRAVHELPYTENSNLSSNIYTFEFNTEQYKKFNTENKPIYILIGEQYDPFQVDFINSYSFTEIYNTSHADMLKLFDKYHYYRIYQLNEEYHFYEICWGNPLEIVYQVNDFDKHPGKIDFIIATEPTADAFLNSDYKLTLSMFS